MERLVIGNWKMHGGRAEAEALAAGLAAELDKLARWDPTVVGVGLAPPFPFLPLVDKAVEGHGLEVVAQTCHEEPKGAFTGEVSAPMLASLGVHRVIVGHSERRALFGETDPVVAKKLRAVLGAGLSPVLCVGETLPERDAGRHEQVVRSQTRAALEGLTPQEAARVVIAYEPVWAIGTGRVATPEQASAMHACIREVLRELFPGLRLLVLYGGSVKPDNIEGLARTPGIDGSLVGGASLSVDSFLAIVRGTVESLLRDE